MRHGTSLAVYHPVTGHVQRGRGSPQHPSHQARAGRETCQPCQLSVSSDLSVGNGCHYPEHFLSECFYIYHDGSDFIGPGARFACLLERRSLSSARTEETAQIGRQFLYYFRMVGGTVVLFTYIGRDVIEFFLSRLIEVNQLPLALSDGAGRPDAGSGFAPSNSARKPGFLNQW